VLVITALVVIGLATGRAEAVALAAPFVAGLSLDYLRRRPVPPTASLEVTPRETIQGDLVEATVSVEAPCDLDVVRLVLHAEGFAPAGTTLDWTVAIGAGERYTTTVPLSADRWGRQRVGPLTVSACTAGNLGLLPDATAAPTELVVYPRAQRVEAGAETPSALAYAGEHPSPRIGPGIELSAVRPYLSGDGLRQINWKATLRSGQLHSTTRLSDRSAAVLVLVDCRHDVGPLGSSSLDVSGQAALAISEHFLAMGDVVSLTARGRTTRTLQAGTGRRQLARVREWLVDLRSPPEPAGLEPGGARTASGTDAAGPDAASGPDATSNQDAAAAAGMSRLSAERPATGWAFVVAVSPLLDEHDAIELASLRQRGAAVVAIDVLGEAMLPEPTDETAAIARRLWLLERAVLLERLGDLGVPIVRWSEQQSLDVALRDVARLMGAPRMAVR
jgi:uncharacterized protein (DUF58 family)